MKVALKVSFNGKSLEYKMTLGQSATLGRSSRCDFQLEDEKISSKHCRLKLHRDRLELIDLDSKNGTYLNGIRVEQSEVFVGDEVKLGDTVISCEEKNFDEEALEALTFPGPFKERLSYELKADFTGARIQNQLANKHISVIPKIDYTASHAREIEIRKTINSRLKLSKQEIRSRNSMTAFISTALDVLALVVVLSVPFYLISRYFPETASKEQKLISLILLEATASAVFLVLNFKVSKFTIGETISGIRDMHARQ